VDVGRHIQSALHPAGPHAEAVASLSWLLFYAAAAILVIVVALAAYALWAPPERRAWIADRRFVVAAGIVFPITALAALLAYTLAVARSIVSSAEPPAVRIEVIGHQWWWRVHYLNERGEVDFETANEIRFPTGTAVEIALKSADVIHSFWVPNLAGKLDMIPGRVNRLRVHAARPGVYRGQCAEYCGGPHAKMAFYAVAEEPQAFARWRDAQRRPAASVDAAPARLGRALVLKHCAACHTVRGTGANGSLGPDLTHVGSRLTLAAGILPNNPGTIASWVSASQQIKPGNLMPSMSVFSGDELRAVAAYLHALQ
jgi:cytochrome c oxidase subunit 2